ncbi:MAG TPA: hypothetical protein DCZ01_12650 [Elusimicrobia bacterium]|nr:MAG: hypothetical protein A2X37_09080 [Elusimicrobia bacterium GWA2_66_18]OGR71133.1 MAG: hypothetical protein A2X40_06930 [Elusimicrobia bacterium GWC2_65_9]HAZ09337.1 hypothetical protein [Elusimicrobiota bacterium]
MTPEEHHCVTAKKVFEWLVWDSYQRPGQHFADHLPGKRAQAQHPLENALAQVFEERLNFLEGRRRHSRETQDAIVEAEHAV